MSREHFISHGILKVLSRGGTVTIDGFNWQEEGVTQELPTATVSSRILCARHNQALASLDAVALRLFQAIDDVVRLSPHQTRRVFLFDGSDFERWLLKTLCGSVFSRNAHTRALDAEWKPNLQWLNILFGGAPLLHGWGFYFAGDSSDLIERGFKLRTLSNVVAGVYGARISFNDELFLFLMETPPADLTGTYLERYLYRPNAIVLVNGGCESFLRFVWADGLHHGGCGVKYSRS
jgi:hypothetical protein